MQILNDALKILDQALQPSTIGQLTRQDWFVIHKSFEIIRQYIADKEKPQNDTDNDLDK